MKKLLLLACSFVFFGLAVTTDATECGNNKTESTNQSKTTKANNSGFFGCSSGMGWDC